MKTNVVKLHKTKCEDLIESLSENEYTELYAIGVKIVDGERIIQWYSSGNESRIAAVGALELLKLKLLEYD